MPALKQYRIYISHAWDYSGEYYRFVNLLDNAPYFNWANYSVPEDDPLHNARSKRAIRQGLANHVRPVHIVVVLSGMYAAHSDWIQEEMDMAAGMNKPIIGIVPWGIQRTPVAVQEAALEMVGWNTSSILSAVRRHAL